ncbi:hypothetical protein UFOVP432_19 [uncultured Caudovirales phage]|uniref:Uncharacterized protein n=1 Tax=uncultured Caudovirales phage TaxID=2100421 RepID=A0A6J5ML25_9CAUD|nr:hypothetical protein UFOVP432_19 [uncultured Caudovirales phage]
MKSTALLWCDTCQQLTCWLKTAVSIKPLITEWRCDKCVRDKNKVMATND